MTAGGKREGAGRRKTLSTLMKEAISNDSQNLPAYFKALSEQALREKEVVCPHCKGGFVVKIAGDRESITYLIDRHMGKAKQQVDIKGGESLGAGLVQKIFDKVDEAQRLREARYLEIEAPQSKSDSFLE